MGVNSKLLVTKQVTKMSRTSFPGFCLEYNESNIVLLSCTQGILWCHKNVFLPFVISPHNFLIKFEQNLIEQHTGCCSFPDPLRSSN